MSKRLTHTKGDVINGLIYMNELQSKNHYRYAIFECYCGNKFRARLANIRSGNTRSCGCLHSKIMAENNPYYKHGDSKKHYLYYTWTSMKQRCLNQNYKEFYNYGGRGIGVYKDWINDYVSFKKWIIDNLGKRKRGRSLDRINNDGNYEPGNLRWATKKEQANNRRTKK